MKNVFVWVDILTIDFDRAVNFYSTILDEKIKVDEFMGEELGFFPMEDDPEGVGGDIAKPDPEFTPSKNGTRIYLNCGKDIDAILGRVEQAGGKIIEQKSQLGEMGWIATIEDSEGNYIGLHGRE